MRRHNGAALRAGLAMLLLLYVASDDSSASDECVDTFLDGKENACSDYITNVDVSLGEVGRCGFVSSVGPVRGARCAANVWHMSLWKSMR